MGEAVSDANWGDCCVYVLHEVCKVLWQLFPSKTYREPDVGFGTSLNLKPEENENWHVGVKSTPQSCRDCRGTVLVSVPASTSHSFTSWGRQAPHLESCSNCVHFNSSKRKERGA